MLVSNIWTKIIDQQVASFDVTNKDPIDWTPVTLKASGEHCKHLAKIGYEIDSSFC